MITELIVQYYVGCEKPRGIEGIKTGTQLIHEDFNFSLLIFMEKARKTSCP